MTQRIRATGSFPKDIPYYPEFVARELGMFEQEDLQVEWIEPKPGLNTYKNLVAGVADIGLGNIWRPLMYFGRLKTLRGFAQLCARCPFILLSREAKPFKWSDLVGKTLIMPDLAPTGWIYLQGLLRDSKTERERINFIRDLPAEEGIALFRHGLGDYLLCYSPNADLLIRDGVGTEAIRLAPTGVVPGWSTYYALADYLDRNSELAGRYARGIQRALGWVLDHDPSEASAVIDKYFSHLPRDVFEKAVRAYKSEGFWTRSIEIPEAEFGRWQDMIIAEHFLEKRVPYSQVVDARPSQWLAAHPIA